MLRCDIIYTAVSGRGNTVTEGGVLLQCDLDLWWIICDQVGLDELFLRLHFPSRLCVSDDDVIKWMYCQLKPT